MEAMARQAAIQKKVRENLAAASKARSEKEEQAHQNIINRRKAEQAAKDSKPKETEPTRTTTKP